MGTGISVLICGEGNGNPLQCSFLENPMDRGAWQATVHGVQKSLTQLSDQHFHFLLMRRREERNLPEVIRLLGDGASTVSPVCRVPVTF